MDTKIMKSLHDILSTFGDKYLTGKELNKARIIQDIDRYDEELIMKLLNNDLIKKHYAKKIGEYTIIETNKLIETFEMDDYWMDSYTKYTKKIGLTTNGRFLDETTNVVLDFPYKDTVLKAGMSKEDVAKEDLVPNEPFFNEVIAAEEIDTLLDKKILVNAKRYTAEGFESAADFSEEDNLILKGNNLLVLHTLKEKYAGKIKLIYIDPPYFFHAKKPEDTFLYNSNFKQSTWLTFMMNRLEIARNLLTEDGALFVQISDDGVAELHLLMKEIFNTPTTNNFINKITVKTKSPSGFQSVNPGVFETAEYIIGFAKNKSKWAYNRQYVEADYDANYKWVVTNIDDDFKNWNIVDIKEVIANDLGLTLEDFKKKYDDKLILGLMAEYALNNPGKVFQSVAISNKAGAQIKKVRDESKLSPHEIFLVRREGQYDVYVNKGREMAFYQKKIRDINGEMVPSVQATNMWTDTPYEGISSEGGVTLKGGKKPEKLIKRIIEMGTDENDLVLDFFQGSGTTSAVAHKLNRKYIGIEQLSSQIDELIIPRLTSVINGDASGISKIVDWEGGGSFVYAELMEKSKGYLDAVLKADGTNSLNKIYRLMLENVDLDFRTDLEQVQGMLNGAISLEDKKRLLVKVIDKNQLYYNYSEIDDSNVRELIGDTDYVFNQSFYKEK